MRDGAGDGCVNDGSRVKRSDERELIDCERFSFILRMNART